MMNWAGLILIAEYFTAGVLSLVIVVLWKKGPNYWPAGRILALAAGAPWIYRGFRRLQLWGQPEVVVLPAVNNPEHLIWLYGGVLLLLLWVVLLQLKTNRSPASREVTLLGKAELQDKDAALYHLRAATRLRKHGVISAEEWEEAITNEVDPEEVAGLRRELAERRARRREREGRA